MKTVETKSRLSFRNSLIRTSVFYLIHSINQNHVSRDESAEFCSDFSGSHSYCHNTAKFFSQSFLLIKSIFKHLTLQMS